MNIRNILETASEVVMIVAPLIRITAPGSERALKLAEVLESAQNVLRFGNTIIDTHLPALAEAFAEIKSEVDALAEAGDTVPEDAWDEVEADINDAVRRVKAALAKSN